MLQNMKKNSFQTLTWIHQKLNLCVYAQAITFKAQYKQ